MPASSWFNAFFKAIRGAGGENFKKFEDIPDKDKADFIREFQSANSGNSPDNNNGAGAVIFTEAAAPTDDQGANGNFWINYQDDERAEIWEKVAGSWVKLTAAQKNPEELFDLLQHITRDLHLNSPVPNWQEATDAQADIYAISDNSGFDRSDVTLTDANFDNNGSDITLPSTPHLYAAIYVRLPIAADRNLYRLYFEGVSSSGGNTWHEQTGPSPETYQYWFVTKVLNAPNHRVHVQTRDPVVATQYVGDLPGDYVGEQAFKNPPSDLTDDQKETVRDAIAAGPIVGSGTGYHYHRQPTLTSPNITSDVALPRTGNGYEFELLSWTEIAGGILANADFISDYEGFIYLDINQAANIDADLFISHRYTPAGGNQVTFSSHRTFRFRLGNQQQITIPLDTFHSRSRIPTGTFNTRDGTEISVTQALLDSPAEIKIVLRLQAKDNSNARVARTINSLTAQNLKATFYQLGGGTPGSGDSGGINLTDSQIGDKAFSNPPSDLDADEKAAVRTAIGSGEGGGQTIHTETATPTNSEGKNDDIWINVQSDERAEIWEKIEGEWLRLTKAEKNPTDTQIGDKAFSNPPGDLTPTEKLAARAAIGHEQPDWNQTQTAAPNFIKNKPSDADFGEKAFKNPFRTLSETEKATVRSAIGSGTPATPGQGGDGIDRLVIWWEEGGRVQTGTANGRQWSLGNGAVGQPIYISEDYEVDALVLTIGRTDSNASLDITTALTTVGIETVDTEASTGTGGTAIEDLEVTIPISAARFMYRGVFTPPDHSPITIAKGSLIRPVTTAPGTGTNNSAGVVTLILKRATSSGGSGGGVSESALTSAVSARNWKGLWVAGAYAVDDEIKNSAGNYFKRLVAGTDTTEPTVSDTDWELLSGVDLAIAIFHEHIETSITVLPDRDDLPNANDYPLKSLIFEEGQWYKAAETHQTTPNLFQGTVGLFRYSAGDVVGIAYEGLPSQFRDTGHWTSNPNNGLKTIASRSDGKFFAVFSKAAYDVANGGTALDDTDVDSEVKDIKVTLADGTSQTIPVTFKSFTDTYYFFTTRLTAAADLSAASAGNSITVEVFNDGTTTGFFTHDVGLKHWVEFTPQHVTKLREQIQADLAELREGFTQDIANEEDEIHRGLTDPTRILPVTENLEIYAEHPFSIDAAHFGFIRDIGYPLSGIPNNDELLYIRIIDNSIVYELWTTGRKVKSLATRSNAHAGRNEPHIKVPKRGDADALSFLIGHHENGTLWVSNEHTSIGQRNLLITCLPERAWPKYFDIDALKQGISPGTVLGVLVGKASSLGSQAWTSLHTETLRGDVTNFNSTGGGWSDWLVIPYNYARADLGDSGLLIQAHRGGSIVTSVFFPFADFHDDTGSVQKFAGMWGANTGTNNDRVWLNGDVNNGNFRLRLNCGAPDTDTTIRVHLA